MVLNPNVNISIQDNITLTQPGGPAVIALIGTAQWGSVSELQTFSSFSQLLDHYKEDKSALSLIKAADIAYGNGAVVVKSIRVVDGDEAKAEKALDGNSGAEVGVLTFSGKYYGTYGNNILVTVTAEGSGRVVEITDGVSIESYTNNGATNGYATNSAIATAINAKSNLVTVAVKTGSETSNLVDAASNQALVGGDDGEDSLVQSDYTTAFDNFLYNESWDLLLTPGGDSLESTDSFQAAMLAKVNNRASSNKKYGMFISGVAVDETITAMKSRTAAGDRLVMCAPNIKYTPRYSGASQSVFNGTYLACALAGNIASNDVEVSPTRKVLTVEGLSILESSGKEYYNLGEIEQVLEQRIVPVSLIEGSIKVARGVTRISDIDDIDFEINIVRIKDYLRGQIQNKLDGFLGNPNLARIRNVMALEVDGVLQQDVLDEVIVNYEPTEVVVGPSPDTVLVNMTVQPTFAINFINVTVAVSRL